MSMNPGQNPFKGLYYYEETDKDIFYGRDKESEELSNLVELNGLTVVFGKSGIGKTSLLNAGLFPLLREKNFLPVRIRLDYSKEGLPLLSQVKQAIRKELEIHGVVEMNKRDDAPADSIRDDETLWEYFHRVNHLNKSFSGDSGGGFLEKSPFSIITPVLVFDQFEEFFTIGKNHPQRELLVEELYWLVEDQVPVAVKERILKQKGAVPYLRADSAFRVVMGLREDYLPYLNNLKQRIPSIHRVLFRLIHLNGFQALEVMDRSGAFTDEVIKKDILDQFYPADMKREEVSEDKLEVEPALFSLLCYHVYEKGVGSLTRQTRDDILADFYDQVLGQLPRGGELAEWIELHLLTEGGFRTPFFLERKYWMREPIEVAIDKKLLRKLHIGGNEHVEIIHDVLAPMINQRRNRKIEEKKRLEIEKELRLKQLEMEKELRLKQLEMEKEFTENSVFKGIAAWTLIIMILMVIFAYIQRNRTVEQYNEAVGHRLALEADLMMSKDTYKAIRIAEAGYKISLPTPPAAVIRALYSAEFSIWLCPLFTVTLKHNSLFQIVVFSPDESCIRIEPNDQTVKLLDIKGNLLAELKGHSGMVFKAVFSPDGSRILTTSDDDTAKLWDIKGNLLVELKGHGGMVFKAVFSPDGKWIVTASGSKTVSFWPTPETIMDYLKTAPIPKLTKEEIKELGIEGFNID